MTIDLSPAAFSNWGGNRDLLQSDLEQQNWLFGSTFGCQQLRSADSKLKAAASISRLQTKEAFLTAASPGLELLMGPPDFLTQFLWTPGTLEGTVFHHILSRVASNFCSWCQSSRRQLFYLLSLWTRNQSQSLG